MQRGKIPVFILAFLVIIILLFAGLYLITVNKEPAVYNGTFMEHQGGEYILPSVRSEFYADLCKGAEKA